MLAVSGVPVLSTSPEFVVHHVQRLSEAAVVFDAKSIKEKEGAVSLKQRVCHVSPTAVAVGGVATHVANVGVGA